MTSPIVPVTVFPGVANTLFLRAGGLGPPPSYYYQLQSVTTSTVDGKEIEDVVVLKDGNFEMTAEQWQNWTDSVDDVEYQLACAATNIGLTLK